MSRLEAAKAAVRNAMIEHGPDGHTDGSDRIAEAALMAADQVMFSDERMALLAIELESPVVAGLTPRVRARYFAGIIKGTFKSGSAELL